MVRVAGVGRLVLLGLAGVGALAGALLVVPLWLGRLEVNDRPFADPAGEFGTVSTAGAIEVGRNPFFRALGTNGRSCATCHILADGWTITPADVRAGFLVSDGLGPLFRPVDAATSPLADLSTSEARRAAYRLFLERGVTRVDVAPPASAEFIVGHVDDPYGYASSAHLSVFRRPLPIANLRLASALLWDGRASSSPNLEQQLEDQARTAVLDHMEPRATPAQADIDAIVAFEESVFAAQTVDSIAGPLQVPGTPSTPRALAEQPTRETIGGFDLFNAWPRSATPSADMQQRAQASIARGQDLFNSRQFAIAGVAGLNDELGQPVIWGTCATCHDRHDTGSGSVRWMHIGTAPIEPGGRDLPRYTLVCEAGTQAGRVVSTTDPGRALVSGRCRDIGAFKVPSLRNLAVRAPYFHDGSAPTLEAVVSFLDARFSIHFTPSEQTDLVAFLRAL